MNQIARCNPPPLSARDWAKINSFRREYFDAMRVARNYDEHRAWLLAIPAPQIAHVLALLDAALIPATDDQITAVLALYAGAWPTAGHKADPIDMVSFAGQLAEEMAEIPFDILIAVQRELRRTSEFLPSFKKIYEPAAAQLKSRRDLAADVRRRLAEPQPDQPRPKITDVYPGFRQL